MTLHIELDSELQASLAAAARAHGIAIEEFALSLIRSAVPSINQKPHATDEEFLTLLSALRSAVPEPEHLKSQTFSREFLYADHD